MKRESRNQTHTTHKKEQLLQDKTATTRIKTNMERGRGINDDERLKKKEMDQHLK